MRDRLARVKAEFDELQGSLQDPAVYSDPKKAAKLGKRLSQLEPIIKLVAEYEQEQKRLKESEAAQDDPELAALAADEVGKAKTRIAELEKKIEDALVPPDPYADRSVILEVRAGTGGEEAALFAAELLRMYIRYAEEKGWTVEAIDRADAGAGGVKEAVVRIEGPGAFAHLRYEGGVHRVQRIPATEAKGRVHTSAATVAVLPEAEEVDLAIRNEDLRIDTYRSGGAGGQHVNKTESAIRITHIPTGVVVSCQTERSQIKNRARAMGLLRTRLLAAEQERQDKEHGSLRQEQVGSGDRSEKIRTYNFPQDRLTDHRLGENFHNLPAIMEGDIDAIVKALMKKDREEKMKK